MQYIRLKTHDFPERPETEGSCVKSDNIIPNTCSMACLSTVSKFTSMTYTYAATTDAAKLYGNLFHSNCYGWSMNDTEHIRLCS